MEEFIFNDHLRILIDNDELNKGYSIRIKYHDFIMKYIFPFFNVIHNFSQIELVEMKMIDDQYLNDVINLSKLMEFKNFNRLNEEKKIVLNLCCFHFLLFYVMKMENNDYLQNPKLIESIFFFFIDDEVKNRLFSRFIPFLTFKNAFEKSKNNLNIKSIFDEVIFFFNMILKISKKENTDFFMRMAINKKLMTHYFLESHLCLKGGKRYQRLTGSMMDSFLYGFLKQKNKRMDEFSIFNRSLSCLFKIHEERKRTIECIYLRVIYDYLLNLYQKHYHSLKDFFIFFIENIIQNQNVMIYPNQYVNGFWMFLIDLSMYAHYVDISDDNVYIKREIDDIVSRYYISRFKGRNFLNFLDLFLNQDVNLFSLFKILRMEHFNTMMIEMKQHVLNTQLDQMYQYQKSDFDQLKKKISLMIEWKQTEINDISNDMMMLCFLRDLIYDEINNEKKMTMINIFFGLIEYLYPRYVYKLQKIFYYCSMYFESNDKWLKVVYQIGQKKDINFDFFDDFLKSNCFDDFNRLIIYEIDDRLHHSFEILCFFLLYLQKMTKEMLYHMICNISKDDMIYLNIVCFDNQHQLVSNKHSYFENLERLNTKMIFFNQTRDKKSVYKDKNRNRNMFLTWNNFQNMEFENYFFISHFKEEWDLNFLDYNIHKKNIYFLERFEKKK